MKKRSASDMVSSFPDVDFKAAREKRLQDRVGLFEKCLEEAYKVLRLEDGYTKCEFDIPDVWAFLRVMGSNNDFHNCIFPLAMELFRQETSLPKVLYNPLPQGRP